MAGSYKPSEQYGTHLVSVQYLTLVEISSMYYLVLTAICTSSTKLRDIFMIYNTENTSITLFHGFLYFLLFLQLQFLFSFSISLVNIADKTKAFLFCSGVPVQVSFPGIDDLMLCASSLKRVTY